MRINVDCGSVNASMHRPEDVSSEGFAAIEGKLRNPFVLLTFRDDKQVKSPSCFDAYLGVEQARELLAQLTVAITKATS